MELGENLRRDDHRCAQSAVRHERRDVRRPALARRRTATAATPPARRAPCRPSLTPAPRFSSIRRRPPAESLADKSRRSADAFNLSPRLPSRHLPQAGRRYTQNFRLEEPAFRTRA